MSSPVGRGGFVYCEVGDVVAWWAPKEGGGVHFCMLVQVPSMAVWGVAAGVQDINRGKGMRGGR